MGITIDVSKAKEVWKNKIRFSKYTLNHLHKESDLFFDWYLKFLFRKKNLTKIKITLKNKLHKKLYLIVQMFFIITFPYNFLKVM